MNLLRLLVVVLPACYCVEFTNGSLKINEIVTMGIHNAYHVNGSEPSLIEWQYTHGNFTELLEYGFAGFELDCHSAGANVDDYYVYHLRNVDNASIAGQEMLSFYLNEIRMYYDRIGSSANTVPIHLIISGVAQPKLLTILANNLTDAYWYKPSEMAVDIGGSATGPVAQLLASGWPTLTQAKNKVIVVNTGGDNVNTFDVTKVHRRKAVPATTPYVFLEPPFCHNLAASPNFVSPDTRCFLKDLIANNYMVRARLDSPSCYDPRNMAPVATEVEVQTQVFYVLAQGGNSSMMSGDEFGQNLADIIGSNATKVLGFLQTLHTNIDAAGPALGLTDAQIAVLAELVSNTALESVDLAEFLSFRLQMIAQAGAGFIEAAQSLGVDVSLQDLPPAVFPYQTATMATALSQQTVNARIGQLLFTDHFRNSTLYQAKLVSGCLVDCLKRPPSSCTAATGFTNCAMPFASAGIADTHVPEVCPMPAPPTMPAAPGLASSSDGLQFLLALIMCTLISLNILSL